MSSSPDYTNENSIIFTIARMNPPMPGHLGLVEILMKEALNKKINHVYVSLSKTLDKKNPIFCEMKKTVLGDADRFFFEKTMINSLKRKMMEKTENKDMKDEIQHIKVHLLCVPPDRKGATPFTPIRDIIEQKIAANNESEESAVVLGKRKHTEPSPFGINLFLVVGEDREEMIDSITNCYSSWKQVNKPTRGHIVRRTGMNSYIQQTETQDGIDTLNITEVDHNDGWSATMIRNIVQSDNESSRAKFLEIYSPYLERNVAEQLYEDILNGLNANKPPQTKRAKKGGVRKGTMKRTKKR